MTNKRDQILDAALLLFTQQGLDKTATATIAKQAGVANGTLFHHFGNKESLIDAVYIRCKLQMLEAMTPAMQSDAPTMQRLTALIRVYLEWMPRHADVFGFLQLYGNSADISPQAREQMQQAYAPMTDLLTHCAHAELLAPLPVSLLQQMMASQLMTAVDYLLENPGLQNDGHLLDQLQHGCVRLITKG